MHQPTRQPFVRWAAAVLLVTAFYLLSYAPVVRLAVGANPQFDLSKPIRIETCDGTQLPIYKPIDWIFDHTPLRTPLMFWASVWDVDTSFAVSGLGREMDRAQGERLIFRAKHEKSH